MKSYEAAIRRGFAKREKNGCVYFSIPALDETGCYRHAFASRIGGVSRGDFASWNFSAKREPNPANVLENFQRMAEVLGVSRESMVMCHYAHGTNAEFVSGEHLGMGITRENTLPFCDGILLRQPGITAVTLHADCNPIFFADRKGRAAGICHAGWRGTLGGMANAMIAGMKEAGVSRNDLLVAIGPSIGPCCFEVQEDVAKPFLMEYGPQILQKREGRQFVDLWRVLLMQCQRQEIPPENVTLCGLCTSCEKELFYSHRRDHGKTGSMGAFLQIKK